MSHLLMDFWVDYSLILQSPATGRERHVASLQRLAAFNQSLLTDPKMEDIQASDAKGLSATQDQSFKLMDLSPEIRLLIYTYAMHNDGQQSSFPALLHVSQQIRREASPVFFRSERFPLVLQPQPHTEMTVLAFDGKTRSWFNLIGPESINALRHVVFRFAPVEKAIIAAGGYSIDLSRCDASDWEYQVKLRDQWVSSSLKRELELIKKHESPLFKDRPEIAAEFRENHIRMCKTAMQLAQDALDMFTDTCMVDKHIKTTADALGELGGALVAVEKARFQHPRP